MALALRVAGKYFSKHSMNGKKASCPFAPLPCSALGFRESLGFQTAKRVGSCLLRVLVERTQLHSVTLTLHFPVLAGEAKGEVSGVHGLGEQKGHIDS